MAIMHALMIKQALASLALLVALSVALLVALLTTRTNNTWLLYGFAILKVNFLKKICRT